MRQNNATTYFLILVSFALQSLTSFAHVRNSLNDESSSSILRQHGKALRELSQVIKNVDINELPELNDQDYYVNQIGNEVVPFLSTRGLSMVDTILFNERRTGMSVCITAGEHQLDRLQVLLHNIFDVHKSNLLIEVFYGGDKDFPPEKRIELINLFPDNKNLVLRDLDQYINVEKTGAKGWDLKPLSVLFASGSEVLLLDADVMLIQPPERFFMDSSYLETGALFFFDRIVPNKTYNPFKALMDLQPRLSAQAKALHASLADKTSYIQEGGAVVIDVQSHLAAVIAMASFTGELSVKNELYSKIYGDKETYFMAFETVGNSYSFNNYYPGVLGNMLMRSGLCGRMLHFDENDEPLWTNGGYETGEDDITDRKQASKKKINPEFFVKGGSATGDDTNQHWTWMEECNSFALEHNLNTKFIARTPISQKAIIAKTFSFV